MSSVLQCCRPPAEGGFPKHQVLSDVGGRGFQTTETRHYAGLGRLREGHCAVGTPPGLATPGYWARTTGKHEVKSLKQTGHSWNWKETERELGVFRDHSMMEYHQAPVTEAQRPNALAQGKEMLIQAEGGVRSACECQSSVART